MRKLLMFGICAVILFSLCIPGSTVAMENETSDYTVTPWNDPSEMTRAAPISGTVTDGEKKRFTYILNSGSSKLDVELSWSLSPNNNELALQITAPNGATFGPYHDMYDNAKNGRIPVSLSSSTSLPSGSWVITVTGESVIGTQPFTLVINES
ncbi:MAG: hypothetical protein O0V67_08285 [Methanocorpusculum sp.]|nr:hypothetical protein [Methanocorpusculum sp.]